MAMIFINQGGGGVRGIGCATREDGLAAGVTTFTFKAEGCATTRGGSIDRIAFTSRPLSP
jgi:hypothetical protein